MARGHAGSYPHHDCCVVDHHKRVAALVPCPLCDAARRQNCRILLAQRPAAGGVSGVAWRGMEWRMQDLGQHGVKRQLCAPPRPAAPPDSGPAGRTCRPWLPPQLCSRGSPARAACPPCPQAALACCPPRHKRSARRSRAAPAPRRCTFAFCRRPAAPPPAAPGRAPAVSGCRMPAGGVGESAEQGRAV